MPVTDRTWLSGFDELSVLPADKACRNHMTRSVEAALTGRRDVFVEALLADGSVTSESIAEQLATELLEAHRDYLPQFT